MLERIIISVVTKILTKLLTWIGKKIADALEHQTFKKKMSEATNEAVENKDPRKLEDVLGNLGGYVGG
jgi:hypothetical protein